jgi:hypothetical protein
MLHVRLVALEFLLGHLKAARAAISNASADESTSWYAPSIRLTLKSITGKPAMTPFPWRCSALFNARDVFFRNGAADDFVLEFEALAGFIRLENDLHAGELTRTAGLLLVRVVESRLFSVIVSR